MQRRIRILIGKVGLDGHDIGIKILSTMLRDAGMEVVFLGCYQTPENIVSAAMDEEVDFVGLSFLGGDHLKGSSRVIRLLKEKEMSVPIIVGGVIPKQDYIALKKAGVTEVFGPGSSPDYIFSRLHDLYRQRANGAVN